MNLTEFKNNLKNKSSSALQYQAQAQEGTCDMLFWGLFAIDY